jgi:hypothetical protein
VTVLGKGWTAAKLTTGSSYVASGLNARKTPLLAVTMSNRLMLFEETVAAYSENHVEHTNTLPNNI